MEISKKDGGFLFDNHFLFISKNNANEQQDNFIILNSHIGKDMNYQVSIEGTIEYPGVYDFNDLHIVCEGKADVLNFVIKSSKANFAIVQDTNSVDGDNYDDIKDVFVINELQSNKFSKLDIDCNIVNLESIS